ncbi:DUF6092 family protein [Thermanaerothrix sp.]|uniref:DUF6092 family protein n=1 Tax=Thermanaerothrix sp. TaxID=2972675 RepID=UPI003C7BD822
MEINETLQTQLFELICYMITSACNLMHETKNYGPFRLIDAASRLVDILRENKISSPQMERIREKIEQGKYKVLEEESQFCSFLNELVLFTIASLNDLN